jgi:crotonobetainyl-CoA:carnitine CoA-transferase CaiB-like acyl-CoA transferase
MKQPDFPLPPSTQALEGVTVLDFSHVIAGPFATYHLAALGARVIKVENPDGGDAIRRSPRGFASFNHGKECLTLDLRKPEDVLKAQTLAATSDVMVDNMRPGVLARRGLGMEQMRALNPRLIHCSISGYGTAGDWASRGAYDHVIQAASGMALMSGQTEDGPIKVGFPVIDCATGILAAFAILAALRRRDLTGLGETIDVSMLGAAMQLMYPMVVDTLATGEPPSRKGNVGYSGSPAADTLTCVDGLLAIGANTPAQLGKLGDALGIGERMRELLDGQSTGFVTAARGAEIRQLLVDAVRDQKVAELETRLNEAGVAASQVRDLAQSLRDATCSGALSPWMLPGDVPVAVPGLGFRAQGLFGGASAPPWTTTPEF